jgi:hypothetical protein
MLSGQIVMGAMLILLLWRPDLPLSRMIIAGWMRVIHYLAKHITTVRALVGIGLALALYAAVWGLQGDAPLILAAFLPELAAWFVTFEMATLGEALIGVGSALVALRASGLRSYVTARFQPRGRAKRSRRAVQKPSNDDSAEGPGWRLRPAA